jgi:hypothetical protein
MQAAFTEPMDRVRVAVGDPQLLAARERPVETVPIRDVKPTHERGRVAQGGDTIPPLHATGTFSSAVMRMDGMRRPARGARDGPTRVLGGQRRGRADLPSHAIRHPHSPWARQVKPTGAEDAHLNLSNSARSMR